MGGCDLHEAFHGLSKNIFQKRLTFLSSGLILIKYMKKTTTIIWIACVIFLVAITTKTMAHDSFNDKVNNWVAKEKEKTIQLVKEDQISLPRRPEWRGY